MRMILMDLTKKKTYSEANNSKKNKKVFRKMKTEDEFDGNAFKKEKNKKNKKVKKDEDSSEDDENKESNEKQNIIIDFKLRNLLFKNKKPVGKRNRSVEKRKKVGFNLD